MKILVTGATGGLGELVVERLLALGHQVVAVSRSPERAKQASFWGKADYRSFNISEESEQDLFSYFGRPDLLVHLAWDKLDNYRDTDHTQRIPGEHIRFLDNLIRNGLKDLTVVGTCYEYGLLEGEARESDPASPVLPYPQGKDILRQHIQEVCEKNSVSWKWMRVFYVFGAVRNRRNLYTMLTEAIAKGERIFNMSGGEQVRDFLSPSQIAACIAGAALQTGEQGIINCCSGEPVVLKDFIQRFLDERNSPMKLNLGFYPYADYEPMRSWGSREKLNRALSEK